MNLKDALSAAVSEYIYALYLGRLSVVQRLEKKQQKLVKKSALGF